MSSYLITGAGRGIGFGFLETLSKDARNTVIGLVRNKEAADAKIAKELAGRNNVHMVEGDMMNLSSLKSAVEEVAAITGGSLDVFIANANPAFLLSTCDPLSELGTPDDTALQEELLRAFNVNVVGNIYLTNMLLPLIRKGSLKKLIYISTGFGDIDLNADLGLYEHGPYCISKAALNMAVAKYHAAHQDEGIIFMAISPGVVDSDNIDYSKVPPEELAKIGVLMNKFKSYAPEMKGPSTVEEAVNSVLKVMDNATIEHNGGRMVSHFGNKRWI